MKPLKIALLAACASMVPALPALAQHAGHNAQPAPVAPSVPTSTCTPEHAAMGHCTLPAAPKAETKPPEPSAERAAPASSCTPEHAAMGHCTLSAAPEQPGNRSPDPHAGHGPTAGDDPAPGHMGEAAGTNLPAGNAPPPPLEAANAADRIYGRQAMNMGRHHLNEHHGGQKFYRVMLNAAEYQFRKGRDSYEWDGEAWYGGDIHRLWLKSEGEGGFGRSLEKAEVQALYSRALDPYWNFQGGIRYDLRPDPSRAYAVIGLEGLAPSFFEIEGALFLSNKGELFARAEASYDQRITQRLILQPSVELNFAAQSSRELGVGAGLSDAEVGLRLRYDIRREFAPYVGVQYSRAFGSTRRYLRAEGEDAGGWSLLTGVRAWF